MRVYILVTAFVLLLPACSSAGFGGAPGITHTSQQRYPPTLADSILVVPEGTTPSRPYSEIGRVSESKHNLLSIAKTGDAILTSLKRQAARMGGHALMRLSEDLGSVSAVVIRFNDQALSPGQ